MGRSREDERKKNKKIATSQGGFLKVETLAVGTCRWEMDRDGCRHKWANLDRVR